MESANDLTARLYNDSAKWSDIIIKYGEHQIHAHKAILVQQSGYFLTAFTTLLPVSSSPIIDLGDDDDPRLLTWIPQYIYRHGTLHDYFSNMKTSNPQMSMEQLIDLFELADKYDVEMLSAPIQSTRTPYMNASREPVDLELSKPLITDCSLLSYNFVVNTAGRYSETGGFSRLFDEKQAIALLQLDKRIRSNNYYGIQSSKLDRLWKYPRITRRDWDTKTRNMFGLFNDGRFSDITICIGGGLKIFAHKAVPASYSTCFQKKLERTPSIDSIDLGIKGSHAAMKAFLKDFYMTDTYSESECSVQFYADPYLLATHLGREDIAPFYLDRFSALLSKEPFTYDYIACLETNCGPVYSRYSESTLSEVVFQQVLHRVRSLRESRDYPPKVILQGRCNVELSSMEDSLHALPVRSSQAL
ncbi:hypothetical protein D6D22_00123 [Aureobasidium pullulans]|uniref:BTB domain-containing protein n=1 Tax=Aureobasidium pullulans TaxID=5580 RepID=A0A4S8YQ57_AURPU|nr:hypothetical protein D6D22_00123 [Aureobasidium pullulans]